MSRDVVASLTVSKTDSAEQYHTAVRGFDETRFIMLTDVGET